MHKMILDERHLIPFIREKCEYNQAFELLDGVCNWMRQGGKVITKDRFQFILYALKANPDLLPSLASLLCGWLNQMRLYPLLISSGILAREGFGRELKSRIYEKFNPSFKNPNDLRDAFFLLFCERDDREWLAEIPIQYWLNLLNLLQQNASEHEKNTLYNHFRYEGLYAIEMLSIWIAAEELEPELMRLDPRLLNAESPFVALQREVFYVLKAVRNHQEFDDNHLQVMFIQCREQIDNLQKKGAAEGSSLNVAYLLERLSQTLTRLAELLAIFTAKKFPPSRVLVLAASFAVDSAEQHSVRSVCKHSVKMLSRSITQNTSDHGEHYITRDKKEYRDMFLSAAGGGVLIALMALLKMYLGTQIGDRILLGIAEGLNYGIGFTLIFILNFTVATKQPAMTAARFAETVEKSTQGRNVDMTLAQLLVDVLRSQSIAVLGNVLVAMSVAAGIAYGYAQYVDLPLLSAEKIEYQLKSIDPFRGTLWFAAIAGVWLFCSGIISGYFDNRCNYLNLRMRLREHPFLKRIMPTATRAKFADYLHNNYGSIMGNLCFGMLLGLTGLVGYLTGLPLDIRHVAFSSANIGYAAVSGEFSWGLFSQSLLFVLLIGGVNLLVSFSMTLWLALRSLGTEIESWGNIVKCFFQIAKKRPLSLFLPMQLDKS